MADLKSIADRALEAEIARRELERATKALHSEIREAVVGGIPLARAARAAGVSRQTAHKWLHSTSVSRPV